MKLREKFCQFFLWKVHIVIFKIMKPYPAAASRYVRKVIEMRECEKDEQSAIIHCAVQQTTPPWLPNYQRNKLHCRDYLSISATNYTPVITQLSVQQTIPLWLTN